MICRFATFRSAFRPPQTFQWLPGFGSLLVALALPACAQGPVSGAVGTQTVSSRPVRQQAAAVSGQMLPAARSGISLAVADLDGSGFAGLVTGYAQPDGKGLLLVQRGNQSQSTAGTEPFTPGAEMLALPSRPDFVVAADLRGTGRMDLVTGTRGARSLTLLTATGAGTFGAPASLPLAGELTALATFQTRTAESVLAAGVCAQGHCSLQLIRQNGAAAAVIALPAPARSVLPARLNGGVQTDLAVLTTAGVTLVAGDSLGNLQAGRTPRVTSVAVNGAVALASGLFSYDRRGFPQLAVLDDHAVLHIFARAGVDLTAATLAEVHALRLHAPPPLNPSGLGWTEVETVSDAGSAAPEAVMLRTRLGNGGYDALAILSGTALVTVAHPVQHDGALRRTAPVMQTAALEVPALAAVSSRVGLLTVNGGAQPIYVVPAGNHTYTVNVLTDAVDDLTVAGRCTNAAVTCTLRDAVGLVNQDSTVNSNTQVDTVLLPAGTITLSVTNSGTATDNEGNADYHLDVDGSANFIGAGLGSTIIDANHLDKVFSIDSGVTTNGALSPLDVFFSGLTIRNGSNANNPGATPCQSGSFCNPFGGAIDFESFGPGTLGFSNVAITGSTALYGPGGAVFVSNSNSSGAASGLTEFDSSTMSGNATTETGGALSIGSFVPLTVMSGSITGNTSSSSVNAADPGAVGDGGGVYVNSAVPANVSFTGTAISGNSAQGNGGGLLLSQAGASLTNVTVTGNSARLYGGGLYSSNGNTAFAFAAAASTFTANTLSGSTGANGAGLCFDAGAGSAASSATVHFARVYGNTGGTFTGLGVGCAAAATSTDAPAVNAADSWWGCNGPASGPGCDTAGGPGAPVLTPYTTLTLTLNGSSFSSGNPVTATASLGQDSAAAVYSTANDAAYLATPISTFTLTGTGGVTYNPSAAGFSATAAPASSNAAATATGNASGGGTATLTVDGQTLTRTFTASAAAALAFTAAPATPVTAGGNAGSVQVSLENSAGAVVMTDNTTGVTLNVAGPGGYARSYTATAAGGVATFNLAGAALTTAGSYTYTASASGYTNTGAQETVNAGSFSTLTVTGGNSYTAPGVSGSYMVRAADSFGNTVTSFTGTVTLASTDASATFSPGTYTYTASDAGSHVFTAVFNTAGTFVLQAQSGTGSGAVNGTQTGIVVADAIWLLNTSDAVVKLTSAGVQVSSAGPAGDQSKAGGVAFDNAGNVWATQMQLDGFAKYTPAGVLLTSGRNVGGLSAPSSVFIDGLGNAWFGNSGSVTEINPAGAGLSPASGFQQGTVSAPTGIVVDISGSVWVTNFGTNSVTKIFGAAAPVVAPTVLGTSNATLGSRP